MSTTTNQLIYVNRLVVLFVSISYSITMF